jgi:hypothetical protein
MKNFFILSIVIVILLTNSYLALAQPQNGYHTQGIFNLQFVLNIAWGDETQEPISPGETREVNLTVTTCVTRCLYGRMLLQILEGRSFPILVSIEDKPDWCTAWISLENIIGVIMPDQILSDVSLLSIRLNEGAPLNYTLGLVKIRFTIDDMKGPFHILTLIQGYEQHVQLAFTTSP